MIRTLRASAVIFAVAAMATLAPDLALAAPAQPEAQSGAELSGELRVAGGSRQPVAEAAIIILPASPGDRPGRPPRSPLDPEQIGDLAWFEQTRSDAQGRFRFANLTAGKLRIVVVAPGYQRLEQVVLVEADASETVKLFLRRDGDTGYRTEVESERESIDHGPTHRLDAQQARRYAGVGDEPLLAAMNLPGTARTPGGFGLFVLRGSDPRQTGLYLDHHPIPRAFHVLPIAGVVPTPMLDRVELSPGNYSASYGSHGGGLVELFSRPGLRDGFHGQAHIDLFDVGATISAPLGPGSMHFGGRRSHVDGVLSVVDEIAGPTGILRPSFWDYLLRVDVPLGSRHDLTLRALGSGDGLRAQGEESAISDWVPFAAEASFHRFDLEYRYAGRDWQVLATPSLRLDASSIEYATGRAERHADVLSLRAHAETRLGPWVALRVGADLVREDWRRRETSPEEIGFDRLEGPSPGAIVVGPPGPQDHAGRRTRGGVWVTAALGSERLRVSPALRLNMFHAGDEQGQAVFLRVDPRLDIKARVHSAVELDVRVGLYSLPIGPPRVGPGVGGGASAGLITTGQMVDGGLLDVPPYLLEYFDPGIRGEPWARDVDVTSAVHASAGVRAELSWDLDLSATLFWREMLPRDTYASLQWGDDWLSASIGHPRQRSFGLELLLRRQLARGLDGWISYTLSSTRETAVRELLLFDIPVHTAPGSDFRLTDRVREYGRWGPGIFDQRHNLAILLSWSLPRGFRVGMRFRLVSGNPERPVLAAGIDSHNSFGWFREPIRGELGMSYRPLFHQLDLRLDKRWLLDRVGVTAYLDVQNVYNHRHPEVDVYAHDWSERSGRYGLPIYPSLGVQVDY